MPCGTAIRLTTRDGSEVPGHPPGGGGRSDHWPIGPRRNDAQLMAPTLGRGTSPRGWRGYVGASCRMTTRPVGGTRTLQWRYRVQPGGTMGKHTRRAGQREALLDYVAGEAREAPPVFAGRRGVIADIEATAATTLARWRDGRRFPGLTRVVQGAPGAGTGPAEHRSAVRRPCPKGSPQPARPPVTVTDYGRRNSTRMGRDGGPEQVGQLADGCGPPYGIGRRRGGR